MKLEVREPAAPPLRLPGDERGDLPDVNVWLALAVQEHPHHGAARRYWEEGGTTRLWFNRVTMLALVRLLCQPKVMGAAAQKLATAFDVYRGFMALPEVSLLDEAPACESQLQRLAATEPPLPARLWTDAYLAAFAISAQLRLITFDRDFERFAGLNLCCLPLPAGAQEGL
jgi:toxin-antitoxin system PIN domain toxin